MLKIFFCFLLLFLFFSKLIRKSGIYGNNSIAVIHQCGTEFTVLFLKINFEKLMLSKDAQFKNIVFEQGFDEIKRVELHENMLKILPANENLIELKIPRFNLKLLERILEQLQEYKDNL